MGTIEAYETANGKRYRVRYRTPDHRQTDKRGFRTKREADLFLATIEVSKAGEYSTLVYVAAYTGLRWGELTALRVRDVNPTRRRLAVNQNAVRVGAEIFVGSPKTHELRSVPFPEFLDDPIAQLCEGKPRSGLLFGDGEEFFGRPRSSEYSRSWFKSALVTAELERMTIHDLRHTAASLAISSGANVKAVQRMLGHASAAMTLDVYADLFDDDLDTVSASLNEARNAAIGR